MSNSKKIIHQKCTARNCSCITSSKVATRLNMYDTIISYYETFLARHNRLTLVDFSVTYNNTYLRRRACSRV